MVSQASVSSSFVVIVLTLAVWDHPRAHHAVSPAFDQGSFEETEGVVSTIRWRNPHIRLTIDSDSGEWVLEGDSANAAARQGFTQDSIRVGDRIRVGGWPSRHRSRELFLTNVLMPNGEETVLTDLPLPLRWTEERSESPASPQDDGLGRSIFRVWSLGNSGELFSPRAPFVYTPAAQASRAAWNPLTDMLALRCIAPGMPNAIMNPYPIEFIDEGDQIRLRIEEWEATRVIDMASGEVPESATSSPLGYSVGHWEDDTFVVQTGRIDFPYLDDAGTPMSAGVQMLERFTVSEDGSRLDYELTVTDPENLVEPAIWDSAWSWVPGTEIRPFECEPE